MCEEEEGIGRHPTPFGKGALSDLYAGAIGASGTNGGEGRVWRCDIISVFLWIILCIHEMSAVVGLAGAFDGELCAGGVVGVENVDIKEEREGILKGPVLVSLAEIMLVIG